jgi:hypothetical protein
LELTKGKAFYQPEVLTPDVTKRSQRVKQRRMTTAEYNGDMAVDLAGDMYDTKDIKKCKNN